MTTKTTYLLLYNTLSSTLWLRILLSVIAAILSSNNVYPHLEPQTRWTQTLAIVEILHAATGLSHFHPHQVLS
jgi:very-long-chain (3R)-3-hydroxyacyl-CoA dehydratase